MWTWSWFGFGSGQRGWFDLLVRCVLPGPLYADIFPFITWPSRPLANLNVDTIVDFVDEGEYAPLSFFSLCQFINSGAGSYLLSPTASP